MRDMGTDFRTSHPVVRDRVVAWAESNIAARRRVARLRTPPLSEEDLAALASPLHALLDRADSLLRGWPDNAPPNGPRPWQTDFDMLYFDQIGTPRPEHTLGDIGAIELLARGGATAEDPAASSPSPTQTTRPARPRVKVRR